MFIIAFLGQYIGYLLGYLCDDELKQGKKYFLLLEVLVLILLFVFNFSLSWLIVIGLLLSLIIKKEYFYFGVFVGFLSWILIFIYGLAYGTLKYKKLKVLLLNVLFAFPLFLLSFWFDLVPLGLGALIGLLIHKLKNFF